MHAWFKVQAANQANQGHFDWGREVQILEETPKHPLEKKPQK